MNIAQLSQYLSPSSADVPYNQPEKLQISLILRTDSYKFSHPFLYPDRSIYGMTSYGMARSGADIDTVIPFGMQAFIQEFLTQQITMEDVDAAEEFSVGHFGRSLFFRKGWEKVVSKYNGYLPLTIRSAPEGSVLKPGVPLYTVSVLDDPDLFWLSAGVETMIQRAIWYPTAIASLDYQVKKDTAWLYRQTGADMSLLPFSLHDFGARGTTSAGQAQIGGMAHTVNYAGSDTVEGILAANFYYKEPMAAFSVMATEHSIECSFGGGEDEAKAYIRKVLSQAVPGSIVSIVIDGYDVYREANLLCTEFRQAIIDSGAKVVFRPDSGDMMEVVPNLLRMQEQAFGSVTNEKGYRKINYVGIIQGDGVDRLSMVSLLGKISAVYGYSADNVVFGSGGALLQKVDRDKPLRFAQKASAILVDDANGNKVWMGIVKNPVTDPGKKSHEGVLTTVINKDTGEYRCARLDIDDIQENEQDIMKVVYHNGQLYNQTTLAEIRSKLVV